MRAVRTRANIYGTYTNVSNGAAVMHSPLLVCTAYLPSTDFGESPDGGAAVIIRPAGTLRSFSSKKPQINVVLIQLLREKLKDA